MKAVASTFSFANSPRRPGRAPLILLLIGLLALQFAALLGIVAGLGSVLVSVLLLGMGVGVLLLARPEWMLWLLLFLVLILNGRAQFFLSSHQLQWVASALGAALLVVSACSGAVGNTIARRVTERPLGLNFSTLRQKVRP